MSRNDQVVVVFVHGNFVTGTGERFELHACPKCLPVTHEYDPSLNNNNNNTNEIVPDEPQLLPESVQRLINSSRLEYDDAVALLNKLRADSIMI